MRCQALNELLEERRWRNNGERRESLMHPEVEREKTDDLRCVHKAEFGLS